jgi:hypothetical protein
LSQTFKYVYGWHCKNIIDISLSLFGREAVRALYRNKLRSGLSAIGIAIGIAAVVCMIAISTAGSQRAEQQLRNLGDNLVWIEAGSRNVNGVRSGSHGIMGVEFEKSRVLKDYIGFFVLIRR